MTGYEKRGGMPGFDFGALSTAESDEFVKEYNAASNNAQREAVIRKWMIGKKETRSAGNARSQAVDHNPKMHVLTSKQLDPIDIDMAAKRRKLAAMRWES